MRVRYVFIFALLTGIVATLIWWSSEQPMPPSEALAPVLGPSAEPVPPPTQTSTSDHAEVFRRAFWRQPSAADRILHAERRIHPEDASWQWFIQLHPSAELLAALRDPENLGLLVRSPDRKLSPWPIVSEPPPDWFPAVPAVESLAGKHFEIRQSSETGLTMLYRAADNMLFATDHGGGFAPPVR